MEMDDETNLLKLLSIIIPPMIAKTGLLGGIVEKITGLVLGGFVCFLVYQCVIFVSKRFLYYVC